MPHRSYSPVAALLLSLLLSPQLPAQGDPRQVYTRSSPDWLRAVAKLEVPGVRYEGGYPRHQRENCSATLVGESAARRSNTLLTAWHCLEDYRDLSRPITVRLQAASGEFIVREARRVTDGGSMHADWALLKLSQPVEREDVAPLPLLDGRASPLVPITMAGYSGDSGLGAGGSALTFDASCRITRQGQRESESDCRAFKGASGGAVIQLDAAGTARFCGVISRGDSETVSYFVPLERFLGAIRRSP